MSVVHLAGGHCWKRVCCKVHLLSGHCKVHGAHALVLGGHCWEALSWEESVLS